MRLSAIFLLFALTSYGAVTTRTVCSAGCNHPPTDVGVQAAISACAAAASTDPCVISVQGVVTLAAPVHLVPSNPVKWIIIRSANLSLLPEGKRVAPADAPNLAKFTLSVPTINGVFIADPETTGNPANKAPSHYILQGLEIEFTGNGANYGGGVNIGTSNEGTKARQYWQAPDNIIVDRCWIHGLPYSSWNTPHALIQGVRVDGRNITVKNSYISDLHMDPVDHGHGETHGIFTSNGAGPLYVVNNRITGAIGSILGGEPPWIQGLVNSYSRFYGNEYYQDPAAYHFFDYNAPGLDTSKPCSDGSYYEQKFDGNKFLCSGGAWAPTTTARPKRDWHKNGWECKNCRNTIVEGNYIHDMMDDTHSQNQHGPAFLVNHVDASIGAPWARPEHIKILNNRTRRTGEGFSSSTAGGAYTQNTNTIRIDNLLMESISHSSVAPINSDGPSGTQISSDAQVFNISISKVTAMLSNNRGQAFRVAYPNTQALSKDLLLTWGVEGFRNNGGSGLFGEGCPTFQGGFFGDISNWALVDSYAKGGGLFNFYYGPCPAPKQRVGTFADVRFVNFNNAENGDYRLCTGSGVPDSSCSGASPLAAAASDGGPLGADIQRINWATGGVADGTPDHAWFEFQIRRADKGGIRYTSYDSGTCSGSIRNAGGNSVHTWTDEGGVNRDRSVTPPSLPAGVYSVKVACTDGRWRQESFKSF